MSVIKLKSNLYTTCIKLDKKCGREIERQTEMAVSIEY